MLLVSVVLLQLAISAVHCNTVIELDGGVTTNIDIEMRRELLIIILGKINDTVNAYKTNIAGCEQKINDTIDECNQCRANLCQPQPNLGDQILGTISAGVNKPVVYAGKVVDDAGKWFQTSGEFMGDRAYSYSKTVGSVATNIGGTLANTGQSVFSSMASGFNNLGSQFDKLGDDLKKGLENHFGGFLNLGSGISNLDNYLKSALNGVEGTLNSFASTVSGWGSDIGDFFSGLFRRRRSVRLRHRRCTKSCPSCDKLDTDKFTTAQITENVCGTESVDSQSEAVLDIQWLQTTFNNTIDNVIITKMEFDYLSADYSLSVPQYATSYYTTAATGRKKLGSNLQLANQTATGIAIAHEYFPIIWAARRSNQ